MGSSYQTRLIAAARAAAATVVRAGGRTDETIDAATEFVIRFTATDFDRFAIFEDTMDPTLDARVHGDLTILCEHFSDEASIAFVRELAKLSAVCVDAQAALGEVETCARTLLVDEAWLHENSQVMAA